MDASRRTTELSTFVFTDVEGSTPLWAADPTAMSASLALHDSIVRTAIEERDGRVFSTAGDSFAAAFASAIDAVECAQHIQDQLGSAAWPGPELRVRIGIHAGEAEQRNDDYFGSAVNTCARVEAAGHGGQIVVTSVVKELAGLTSAGPLGEYRLRGVPDAISLFQVGDGSFPALRGVHDERSNLPTLRVRLLGRDEDIAAIRAAIATDRLVTLAGPGGIGKTSVAIEAAGASTSDFAGGAHFVDLTTMEPGGDLVGAVCRGLLLEPGADPYGRLIGHLDESPRLLVVDNCEHVIDAAADLIDRLLADAPAVTVLATSRETLDLDGERILRIEPLATDSGSASVRLFLERAVAVRPDIEIGDDERASVARVCERLDGVPLAIELAAARTASMAVSEIENRLDDRFGLLAGKRRGRLGRQQTLRAALDWSIDLLAPEETELLMSLSVFVAEFDLDGVAAVGELTPVAAGDLVESLHAKSLIQRRDDADGRARYRLLETVKEWGRTECEARERTTELRNRHASYFADALSHCDPFLWLTAPQRWWFDNADVAAAIEHLRIDDPVGAAFIAGCQAYALFDSGHGELVLEVTAGTDRVATPVTRPRLWAARRIAQNFALADPAAYEAPPPTEDTDDWKFLVGGPSSYFSGVAGWQTVWTRPEVVLSRVAELDEVLASGRSHDPRLCRLSFESAVDAALQLGHHELALVYWEKALELSIEHGLDWMSFTTSLHGAATAALLTGADLRHQDLRLLAPHVYNHLIAAIAAAAPDDRRNVVAEIALQHCHGRLIGEESFFLPVFAHYAIVDGDLDRARHLNRLGGIRTPASFALKRHNGIRIEGTDLDRIGDPQHHLATLFTETSSMTRHPDARRHMLDEARRIVST